MRTLTPRPTHADQAEDRLDGGVNALPRVQPSADIQLAESSKGPGVDIYMYMHMHMYIQMYICICICT